MTPEYILKKSLCREPHCSHGNFVEAAQGEIENLGYAHEYAEPGYDQPKKGILFADWNHFPRDLDRILERYGYNVEWSDEWSFCDDCAKAVRSTPDSYSWLESGYYNEKDGSYLCQDCVLNDPESYLESLEDRPGHAIMLDV